MTDMPQDKLINGRYAVQEQIGAGGMGVVYRAVDRQTREDVAVKLLRPEAIASDHGLVERFKREATALQQLNHPSIIRVLDTLVEDDRHYIVMEYMPAGSLRDVLQHEGPMPIDRMLSITLDLADALTRAHRLDIIHRDLKPANVLLASDGTPRLTDFGVARIGKLDAVTGTGMTLGTLDYLPPEILNGQAADARMDIWSFGVLLFEMVTGMRPFTGEAVGQVLTAIMTEMPPSIEELRPDCPIGLVDLIYRMLEKDPQARIPSVRLVGAELEALMQGQVYDTSTERILRSVLPTESPAEAARFATPTSKSGTVRNNLPVQVTPFIGREHELKEMERLLRDPAIRLVTILAPGGMGKTRLSLEAAAQQLSHFADGVFFVELDHISAPENIPNATAEALGIGRESGEGLKQEILDFLREKHILLVMDNFEHVLDGAGWVGEILRAAPQAEVVATTREKLGLDGETLFILGGMDFPEWETPADALEYAAVKLFMQSALRVRPQFELRAEDLTCVARICRMVGGMPLGIVLAAAWLETLSLAEIAQELGQSIDLLESDRRDIPDRQRSIRAVFDYSWNLMDEEERRIFQRFAVFRGGCTRQAAQAVSGASLRQLSTLLNKSLLLRDPVSGRYQVHELLRQYAEEHLHQSGDEASVHEAHSSYYLNTLAERVPDMKGRRQFAALDEVDSDFENLRAAWQWAARNKKGALIDLALEGLDIYCRLRRRFRERDELVMMALQELAGESDRGRGRLLAYSYTPYIPEDAEVAQRLEAALPLLQNDRREKAYAHYQIASLNITDSTAEALVRQHLDEALAIYRELDEPFYVGLMLHALGFYYSETDPAAGEAYNLESLAAREACGDKIGAMYVSFNIATQFWQQGDCEKQAEMLNRVVALCRETGNNPGLVQGLTGLMVMEITHARPQKARPLANEVLQLADYTGFIVFKAQAYGVLALAALLEDDYPQALRQHEISMNAFRVTGEIGRRFEEFLITSAVSSAGGDLAGAESAVKSMGRIIAPGFKALNTTALFIGSAALLLAETWPDKAYVVSLFGLVLEMPDCVMGWMKKWPLVQRTLARLESEMGPEAYRAAWEQGRNMELQTAAREIYAMLQ